VPLKVSGRCFPAGALTLSAGPGFEGCDGGDKGINVLSSFSGQGRSATNAFVFRPHNFFFLSVAVAWSSELV